MKLSQEILNHFNCDWCKYWWSIASIRFEVGQKLYCPYCNYENTINEISTVDNIDYSKRPTKKKEQ